MLSGHPDLAGRLADSNLLTPESAMEQREAGLDLLTAEERLRRSSERRSSEGTADSGAEVRHGLIRFCF